MGLLYNRLELGGEVKSARKQPSISLQLTVFDHGGRNLQTDFVLYYSLILQQSIDVFELDHL